MRGPGFARGFWPTFLVQALGALNDNIFKNVVVLTLAFAPAADAIAANQLVIAAGGLFIVPFALFSLVGGMLADRMDKATLVRRLKALEIALMGIGAGALAAGNVWLMLGVCFAMGTQSAFFGPTKYAILPQHLPASVLPEVNGFFQLSTFVAILAGTVIGGLASAVDSAGPRIAGALVLGVALAGFLASLFIPPAPPAPVRGGGDPPAVGLRQTIRDQALNRVVLGIAWLWFAAITVMGLVPGLTRDLLGGSELSVTWLLVALTVGVGFGCTSFVWISRLRSRLMVALGAVLTLVALTALAVALRLLAGHSSPPAWGFPAVAVCCTALGAAAGLYIVPLITRLQRAARLAVRARVIALSNLVNAIFMIVASVAALVLVERLDYWAIFTALAAASAVLFAAVVPGMQLDSPAEEDTIV